LLLSEKAGGPLLVTERNLAQARAIFVSHSENICIRPHRRHPRLSPLLLPPLLLLPLHKEDIHNNDESFA
jgi:hypothetical protein